jgi:glycosyltransferase 2 family protein
VAASLLPLRNRSIKNAKSLVNPERGITGFLSPLCGSLRGPAIAAIVARLSLPIPPPELERASQLPLPARIPSFVSKLAISLLVAAGFFWLLRRGGLAVVPPPSAFAGLAWWALPAYVLLYGVATVLRTYRWIHLLRPIQPRLEAVRVLGIGLIGFMAILFAPLRSGEVVRPWLLARDGEVNFLQAAGTVGAERIVDGLTLTILLSCSLLFATPLSPLPERLGQLPIPVAAVPGAATLALSVFAMAFVAMALFYWFRAAARSLVHATLGRVSPSSARFVSQRLEHLADGLGFLRSRRHAVAFLRDTALYWALSAISFWVLLRGCGVPGSFVQACAVMGIMGIGSLIPSGPGFFGAYQMSAYCGLAMYFSEPIVLSAGAAFTFLSYVVQITATAGFGMLGFRLAARRTR